MTGANALPQNILHAQYGFHNAREARAFYEGHTNSVTESGPKRSRSKVLSQRSNDFRRKGNEDHLEAAECLEMAQLHRRKNDPEAARIAEERAGILTARAESRIRRSDALHRTAMKAKTIKDRLKAGGLHIFVGVNTLSMLIGLLCTPIQNKQLDQINENIGKLARQNDHGKQLQLAQMPSLPAPLSYIV